MGNNVAVNIPYTVRSTSARPADWRGVVLGIGCGLASATGTHGATAGDFTQDECKGIRVTVGQVVSTVGKDTLSYEFRKSLVNWMGADLRCNGPKDIIVKTENDSATYRTIRSMLLAGSHPLSLQKAGLRPLYQPDGDGADGGQPKSPAKPVFK